MKRWQDIAPADATEIDLSKRLDITAPLNENGERCPWPWDPQQLKGAPIGQYHCGYCGAMCLAGVEHPDYGIEGPTPPEGCTDGCTDGAPELLHESKEPPAPMVLTADEHEAITYVVATILKRGRGESTTLAALSGLLRRSKVAP